VFLSTDAGGTGLNLQTADTVVNLELPWNPAVLEQRIARVHRMGQSRPVRVINFVTRGTIEEKVLRTVEAKQGLFAGVFESDADEIPFAAVNTGGFLATMRELVTEEAIPASGGREPPVATPTPSLDVSAVDQAHRELVGVATGGSPCSPPPLAGVWHGIAQIVEGACAVIADPTSGQQLPADIRLRVLAALRSVGDALGPGDSSG
jgi:hypothetical protein